MVKIIDFAHHFQVEFLERSRNWKLPMYIRHTHTGNYSHDIKELGSHWDLRFN